MRASLVHPEAPSSVAGSASGAPRKVRVCDAEYAAAEEVKKIKVVQEADEFEHVTILNNIDTLTSRRKRELDGLLLLIMLWSSAVVGVIRFTHIGIILSPMLLPLSIMCSLPVLALFFIAILEVYFAESDDSDEDDSFETPKLGKSIRKFYSRKERRKSTDPSFVPYRAIRKSSVKSIA